MMRRVFLLALIITALLFAVGRIVLAERLDGGYYTLVDEDGRSITMTARHLDIGDAYIAADNKRYEVVAISGDEVQVRYTETITLPEVDSSAFRTQVGGTSPSGERVVGIYHTHNDESYVPSSGTESRDDGRGDILQVGRALADAMENLGFTVIWSDNSHLPHDGQAYTRSRRTAMELLEKEPITLIDVHRDATPPEVYETEIEGQPATKVRIVVGRQNQNREANLEYAKRIKAVADEEFPGIIEGIFDARGNYNQDLGPRMILLEFGAHTNYLEHAQQAAEFFAKVIPAAAGIEPGQAQAADKEIGAPAGRSVFWILGIAAAVLIVYLVINRQGLGSITSFFRREAGLGGTSDDDPGQENG
ncbi:MAG: stage II sporulation protein P [Firmicutes bacterium]|jgi:stage II sporulation protein P|nr:stage II sporulation protein P [Bacillota bacterium]